MCGARSYIHLYDQAPCKWIKITHFLKVAAWNKNDIIDSLYTAMYLSLEVVVYPYQWRKPDVVGSVLTIITKLQPSCNWLIVVNVSYGTNRQKCNDFSLTLNLYLLEPLWCGVFNIQNTEKVSCIDVVGSR